MTIDPTIIKRYLAPFSPVLIYQFGSTVTSQTHKTSDLDIAFLPSHPCNSYDVFTTAQTIALEVGCEVDLIDLSLASVVMRAQIVTKGKDIYVKDKMKKAYFEMYTFSDYAKLNEQRKQVLKNYQ